MNLDAPPSSWEDNAELESAEDLDALVDPRTSRLEPTPDDAAARYTIVISTEQCIFTALVPLTGTLSVGRASNCDVAVPDDSISRRHALIRGGPAPTIEDAGSTNGTRVLGRRLSPGERVPLEVGTVAEIGKALIIVQRGDAAAATLRADGVARASIGLLLKDPTMKHLYRLLDVVSPTTMSVLILGETGVGKEVFAKTIHARSSRAQKPFLKLNCAALPESILESELFGHERGAFTGALQTKIGLFESADGGTVFLDELGELPLPTQAKLLRVLETGEVMRVGSVKTKRIDIRLVAATNRDLQVHIAEGLFRADLFFRVNGFAITIPPLRARKADIAALTEYFLSEARRKLGASGAKLSPAAIEALQSYTWPGNIRELHNVLDRAALLCTGGIVEPGDLAICLPTASVLPRSGSASTTPSVHPVILDESVTDGDATREHVRPSGLGGLRAEMESLERHQILAALKQCGGNQSRAARMLGMARRTLLVRLDTYGVVRPRKNAGG